MPHLHIEKFKDIEYPQVKDEVTFNFVAINSNHDDEKLISVTVEDEDFFLLVKDEKDRSLLKSDKLTRPASIYNVHRALLASSPGQHRKDHSQDCHHPHSCERPQTTLAVYAFVRCPQPKVMVEMGHAAHQWPKPDRHSRPLY